MRMFAPEITTSAFSYGLPVFVCHHHIHFHNHSFSCIFLFCLYYLCRLFRRLAICVFLSRVAFDSAIRLSFFCLALLKYLLKSRHLFFCVSYPILWHTASLCVAFFIFCQHCASLVSLLPSSFFVISISALLGSVWDFSPLHDTKNRLLFCPALFVFRLHIPLSLSFLDNSTTVVLRTGNSIIISTIIIIDYQCRYLLAPGCFPLLIFRHSKQ